MEVEYLALLVAIVSLVVSAYQLITGNAEKINSRRTLLLQRILEVKSMNYINLHELIGVLTIHHDKMPNQQVLELKSLDGRMRKHDEDLEHLHEIWSDYEDGSKLKDIEKELSVVELLAAETRDTGKIIETGKRSYE